VQGVYFSLQWDKVDEYVAATKRVSLAIAASGSFKNLVAIDLLIGEGPVLLAFSVLLSC